jgi:hypothetical protein
VVTQKIFLTKEKLTKRKNLINFFLTTTFEKIIIRRQSEMSTSVIQYNAELGHIQPASPKITTNEDKNAVTICVVQNGKQSNEAASLANRISINCCCYRVFLRRWCYRVFLRRYMKAGGRTLIWFRLFAICLGVICTVSETIAFTHSGGAPQELRAVRFMVGGNYVYFDIAAINYVSGAAAFGTTIDFVVVLLLSIVNCILVHINCESSVRASTSLFSVINIVALYLFVELCHQHFKKRPSYNRTYRKAAQVMLRQTLLFSYTALFVTAAGLLTVQRNVAKVYPLCSYLIDQCALVELYRPQFEEGHPCEDDFIQYIRGREELRIIRNFVYIDIAFYAMFDKMFLEVTTGVEDRFLRVPLIFLFILLSSSVVYSNVTPYNFVEGEKTFYDIINVVFFTLLLIILAYKLYRKSPKTQRLSQNSGRSTPKSLMSFIKLPPYIIDGTSE